VKIIGKVKLITMNYKYKKGGMSKSEKAFAKLAPPFDKISYADKIVGATKQNMASGGCVGCKKDKIDKSWTRKVLK